MHYPKSKPPPLSEFGPWTAVHFQTQEIRDRFLDVAGPLPTRDVQVESMPDESRGAMVRWCPGQFLRLNDIAHAHGGRIIVMQRRGWRPRGPRARAEAMQPTAVASSGFLVSPPSN